MFLYPFNSTKKETNNSRDIIGCHRNHRNNKNNTDNGLLDGGI